MIAPQFQNKVNSSVFLWLNNLLAQKGSGFYNYGSYFYPTQNKINGLYTYSAPFSQFISDFSVSGAIVPTGIYINSNFVSTGQSGFFGFNYEKGLAYFTQAIPSTAVVSGRYSIKDFNISMTNNLEESILFETQLSLRPKTAIGLTGQADDETSFPVIFIKNNGYENQPFSFGGTESTKVNYTFFIFADSQQQLDAVEGLICDSCRTYMPYFEVSEMPYDAYGRIKNSYFNYLTVKQSKTAGSANSLFIEQADKSRLTQRVHSEIKTNNPQAHFSTVNLTVTAIRNPRS